MMAAATDRIAITPAERRAAVLDLIAAARSRLILSLFRCADFQRLARCRSTRPRRHLDDLTAVLRWPKGLDQIFTVLRIGATMHRYATEGVKYTQGTGRQTRRRYRIGEWKNKARQMCDFI